MPRVLICPQCGAPLKADAASCLYCGVNFSAEESPIVTAEPAPPLPADWTWYSDPWVGFRAAHPAGWAVSCTRGMVSVHEDAAGLCAAVRHAIALPAGLPLPELARQWVAPLRSLNPGLKVWTAPFDDPSVRRLLVRSEVTVLDTPLLGRFVLSAAEPDVWAAGFQCPRAFLQDRAQTLLAVLTSFQHVERMARVTMREPLEGAFQFSHPAGWTAQTGVLRDPLSGTVAAQLSVQRDAVGLVQAAAPWFRWTFQEGLGGWQQMPYLPAAAFCQQYLMGWLQQQYADIRLEAVQDRPDLLPFMRQEFLKAGFPAQRWELSAAFMFCQYSLAGVRLRQAARVMVVRQPAPDLMGFPTAAGQWTAYLDVYYRAPLEEFTALEPVLQGVLDSVQMNQNGGGYLPAAAGRWMGEIPPDAWTASPAEWTPLD